MPYEEFCVFFSAKLFYKSNRKLFSCVCIAWYKHSRRWENSRRLCKPSTSSWACIPVSNSPNPSSVYIRLCKHGKHFLLLKYLHADVVKHLNGQETRLKKLEKWEYTPFGSLSSNHPKCHDLADGRLSLMRVEPLGKSTLNNSDTYLNSKTIHGIQFSEWQYK